MENNNGLANGRATSGEYVADVVAVGVVSGITEVAWMLTGVEWSESVDRGTGPIVEPPGISVE